MQKIHLHKDYQFLKTDILDFLQNFDTKGEYVVKGDRNSIKKVVLQNVEVNVKQFKKPNSFNAFVYKYIRQSKAKRSFDYANKLISFNVLTPFPVAYVEETSVLGLKSSFYISKHVNYDFDFRVLIHQQDFPDRINILKQFTGFTFKLHENNVNFLDHSPGNTLIVQKEGNYDFYLIDLNRMSFETMTFDKRMRNFRRLWLSKTMIKIISDAYSKLYNKESQETYDLMLKHSRSFQLKVNSRKLRKAGRRLKFKA